MTKKQSGASNTKTKQSVVKKRDAKATKKTGHTIKKYMKTTHRSVSTGKPKVSHANLKKQSPASETQSEPSSFTSEEKVSILEISSNSDTGTKAPVADGLGFVAAKTVAAVEEKKENQSELEFEPPISAADLKRAVKSGVAGRSLEAEKQDVELLKKLYKELCGYELDLEIDRSMLTPDNKNRIPLVLIDQDGRMRVIETRPIIGDKYTALQKGEQNRATEYLNQYMTPGIQANSNIQQGMLSQIYVLFYTLGTDCSYLGCGHFTKELFYCKRPIQVVNNQHVIEPKHGVLTMHDIMAMQLVDPAKVNYRSPGPLEMEELVEWQETQALKTYFDGTIVSIRLMFQLSQQGSLCPFLYSQRLKYPTLNSSAFYRGNHIDAVPDETRTAAAYCKDVGGKESFQSLILSAINGMLRTENLRDVLRQGWVSSANFLCYCLVSFVKGGMAMNQYQAICHRFISTAGLSMDFFLNIPIALSGNLTCEVEEETKGKTQKKSKLEKVDGFIQLVSLYCYDYYEVEAMNKLKDRVRRDFFTPKEVQTQFTMLVVNKHIKRLTGLGAAKPYASTYTMVEAFANKDQQRIHVYSLARANQDGTSEALADNNLYLSELITVPAAYDENNRTVDPFDDTGAMTDLEFYSDREQRRIWTADPEGKLVMDRSHSETVTFWKAIYQWINERPSGFRKPFLRLANVLNKFFGNKYIHELLETLQDYTLETISFYGIGKTTEKSHSNIAATALRMKLAGSELVRHVVLKPIKQSDGAKEAYMIAYAILKNEEVSLRRYGVAQLCSSQNIIQQYLAAVRKEMSKSEFSKSQLLQTEGDFYKEEVAKREELPADDIKGQQLCDITEVKSDMLQIVTEQLGDPLLLAANAKDTLLAKMCFIYLNGISIYNVDTNPEFAKWVQGFCNINNLLQKTAKVPFFTGFDFAFVNPEVSGRYRTLWSIHPAPLFFNYLEYSKIVSSGGAVPAEIGYIAFKNPSGKKACNLMRILLKHLYGWLASGGVFLNNQEFQDQAMSPGVIQNFLLYPMQRGWYNFQDTLKALNGDLSSVQGFIKKRACPNQFNLTAEQHQQEFEVMVIRLNTVKHTTIHNHSDDHSYSAQRSSTLSPGMADQWNPYHELIPVSSTIHPHLNQEPPRRMSYTGQYDLANLKITRSRPEIINDTTRFNGPHSNGGKEFVKVHNEYLALDMVGQQRNKTPKNELSITMAESARQNASPVMTRKGKTLKIKTRR